MKCPRCQAENREGRRFCAACGASLALTCPSCGFSFEPGEKFCRGCGQALAPGGPLNLETALDRHDPPMTGRLHIAVTPWRDPGDGTAEVLVAQAERAEALGFHSFWVPENHFSASGSIPAPLLLQAAVAARTNRLKIGTTSYLLPVRNPIQVAEEVAVLDRLSHGRVILGVGRGFRKTLFAAYDIPPAEKRERFEASLAAMRSAWQGEPVAWIDGESAGGTKDPIYLAPLPLQKPHPPIWVAAFGPKAMHQAGRLGLPYLASPLEPLAVLEANYARHREAALETGNGVPDTVPIMRTVFISRSSAQAVQVREALAKEAASLARSRGPAIARSAGAPVDDWALVGDPELVSERISEYRERLGITHLIAARLRIPGIDPALIEGSTDLLARLNS